MAKRSPVPPNYRGSQSCGTCHFWVWGYEGEGDCKRYPDKRDRRTFASIHSNYSTSICDDYKAPEASKHG